MPRKVPRVRSDFPFLTGERRVAVGRVERAQPSGLRCSLEVVRQRSKSSAPTGSASERCREGRGPSPSDSERTPRAAIGR